MKKAILILLMIVPILAFNQQKQPKLVVGIVVDQMRYDYLIRFADRFGEGGFKRLMKGLNCIDAHYNYVPTYTGPGHASIYSGKTPSDNGIVGNAWYSREEGKIINCVEDSKVKTVGSKSDYGKFSPKNLKVQSMLEIIKSTKGSKAVSVSFKNRGAILPAGTNSDGVYWFDYSNGNFVTSTHYAKTLPAWVQSFNDQHIAEYYKDSTWNTMYPIETYKKSRSDDNHFEVALNEGKPVFPYDLGKLNVLKDDAGEQRNYFNIFSFTPYANTFLLNFGLEAIVGENLGKDDKTDVINISISSTDIAGHMFGPYSVEIEDIYLRLDKDLENFLNMLDKIVGKDDYVVFLTADHGVVPNPDYLKNQGKQGGYVVTPDLKKRLEALYADRLKFGGFIKEIKNNNIYFNMKAIRAKKVDFTRLKLITKQFLLAYDGIEVVFDRDDLIKNEQKDHKANMVKRGVNERSGELIFLTKHGYLPIDKDPKEYKGTSHGSVWEYDTHVPLLFYGNNIPESIRKQRVEITEIAGTILNYLGIKKEMSGGSFNLK